MPRRRLAFFRTDRCDFQQIPFRFESCDGFDASSADVTMKPIQYDAGIRVPIACDNCDGVIIRFKVFNESAIFMGRTHARNNDSPQNLKKITETVGPQHAL